jgi:hypothetical protein
MNKTSTLLPRHKAIEKHLLKINLILLFLRDEKWSHQNILQELLQLKSRQATHKTLLSMEAKNLVKRHLIKFSYGRPITVWGITPHGVMMSFCESEPMSNVRAFEPSKLKITQMNHTLDIQQTRIKTQVAGWKEFNTAGFCKKNIKNPDATARRPDGKVVAFEIERTIKSLRRYPDVLVSHLKGRKQGLWDEIYYLCPDINIKARLIKAFDTIETAQHDGNIIKITKAHKDHFKFFTYSENWQQFYLEESK